MKKYFLLFAAALVLGVTACVDTPEPAPDPIVPELSVDVESIEATIEGLDTEFNITSNVEWAVTTEQDWISIDPAMGEGNSLVLVTVDENKTYDVREGAITVEVVGEFAGQVETITIPVVQDEVKAAILDAKSKYEFEKEGGSFSVTMKANVEYSVELGADWLSIAEADATRALKED
ncbi:MAG: BACON domain-containing protein, partial [Rikenellaceae bacterium]|nr:BACON domain-containing protein [Rikenellaceae bacterium]